MGYNTESYTAGNHKEWAEAGLKDYGDFSDCVEYVNQEDDYCDSLRGEWWYADDATFTIYSGTFGNDHSPGASHYTYAEVFCDAEEYKAEVKRWEAFPEYLEHEEDCECESCEEDREDEDEDEGEDEDENYIAIAPGTGPNVKMSNGYAHEYESHDASDDDMDLVCYTPRGDETPTDYRKIDGSWHVVFYCPVDGMYRAQTCVYLGVPAPV